MDTILFLCPSLVGAGVERRICILLKHLDQTHFRYALGLMRHHGQFLSDIDNEKIVYVEKPRWLGVLLAPIGAFKDLQNFFFSVYQINKLIQRNNPSIILTFTLETTVPAFFVKLAGRYDKVKWIISEDSNTPEAISCVLKQPFMKAVGMKFFSWVYQSADFVTAVSNSVKTSLLQGYNLQESNINVIHNPVDPQAICSRLESGVRSPVREDYLLAVGRLEKVKQYDLLLEAFALIQKNKQIKLVILGEGPEEERLRSQAAELGIEKDVLFLGFHSNPWIYMKHAKLLLLTSRQEGFSNVIVEAMMLGCPVISTKAGGPDDIMTDNKNGILVDHDAQEIAEATLGLLENHSERRKFAKQAHRTTDRFLPAKICTQVSAMFDAILLKKGRYSALKK